ncbi:MAG: hypothetical protein JWM80_2431 [Cyanobacteria bacterium RYN_339]|nr:hypothetical protein [Cyanobacteria bacterium RYN_339]
MERRKDIWWVGSAKRDMRTMPKGIRADFGYGLHEVADGRTPVGAKALKGFGSADVLELRADEEAGTFRAVYTVRFEGLVFVLHAFQKKSHRGAATSNADVALIKARLATAEAAFQAWKEAQGGR